MKIIPDNVVRFLPLSIFLMASGFLFVFFSIRLISAAAPVVLDVFDGYDGMATTSSYRGWWDSISHSPAIDHYEVAISTSGTCSDTDCDDLIAPWESVGLAIDVTLTGLDLVEGGNYYFCVKAVSDEYYDDGLSASTTDLLFDCSDGVTIDLTAPVTDVSAESNGEEYAFGSSTNSDVIITLGSQADDYLATFYCLGTACSYPDDYSTYSDEIDISDEGETVINFLSQDTTGNLEEIRSEIIRIDQTPPAALLVDVPGAESAYSGGDSIMVRLVFDEPVAVSGDELESLRINLNIQDSGGYAIYDSGSGSSSLYFRYDVQPADYTTHLDYYSYDSLEFNGNSIADLAGNEFDGVLPDPTDVESGSLGNNENIVVNAPIFTYPADSSFASGTLTMLLSAMDNDGISGIEIYSGDLDLGSSDLVSGNDYSFFLDTRLLPDGENQLQAVKTSGQGNIAYSDYFRLFTDNHSPATGTLSFRLASSTATSTVSASGNQYYLGSYESAPDLIGLDVVATDANLATGTINITKSGTVVGHFVYDQASDDGTWLATGIDSSDFSQGNNDLVAVFSDSYGRTSTITIRVSIVVRYLNIGFVIAESDSSTSTASTSLAENTVLSVSSGTGTSSVVMSTGTVITKIDGGVFDLASITASSTGIGEVSGIGSGFDIKAAMQWGIPDIGLAFDPAIQLNIYVGAEFDGQTLYIKRSTSGQSGWTDDGIVSPKTCLVADGVCSFYTTKASYFSVLSAISTNSGNTGGSLIQSSYCQSVVYGAWQDKCFDDIEYRYVESSFPTGCRLTKLQLADGKRQCRNTVDGSQGNVGNNNKDDGGAVSSKKPRIKGLKIYAEGTLLRGRDKKIYVIRDGKAMRVFSLVELRKYANRAIIEVSDEVLVENGVDNILLRSSKGKIFLALGGKLIYIVNLSELQKYVGRKIYDVEEEVIQKYKEHS